MYKCKKCNVETKLIKQIFKNLDEHVLSSCPKCSDTRLISKGYMKFSKGVISGDDCLKRFKNRTEPIEQLSLL